MRRQWGCDCENEDKWKYSRHRRRKITNYSSGICTKKLLFVDKEISGESYHDMMTRMWLWFSFAPPVLRIDRFIFISSDLSVIIREEMRRLGNKVPLVWHKCKANLYLASEIPFRETNLLPNWKGSFCSQFRIGFFQLYLNHYYLIAHLNCPNPLCFICNISTNY